MHVVILSPVFPPYAAGMAHVAHQHASFLHEAGHEVTVITPKFKSEQVSPNFPFSVVNISSPIVYGNAAYIPSSEELTALLQRADRIILEYPFIDCIGALRAFFKKNPSKKLHVYYHMDLLAHSWKKIPFVLYTHKAMKFFAALAREKRLHFAGSTLSYIAESDGRQFTPIAQEIPLVRDEQVFTPLRSSFLDDRLQLSPNIKKILFVGALDRAHAFKGISVLLNAVKEKKDCAVVIVGDGDMKSKYEQIAASQKNAHFLGKLSGSDLVAAYQSADVLILPSTSSSEAFGLVLVEAQMCGTSVIASDLRGVRSVVNPETGILVPAGNSEALSRAIDTLPRKTEISLQNNRMFAEKFSTETGRKNFLTWVLPDKGV